MKKLLFAALLALAVSAQGAITYVGKFVGDGSGLTNTPGGSASTTNVFNLMNGSVATNLLFRGAYPRFGNVQPLGLSGRLMIMEDISGNYGLVGAGPYLQWDGGGLGLLGNGGGLTNLIALQQYMRFVGTNAVNPPWEIGKLFYDADTDSLSYYSSSSNVTHNINRELNKLCWNATGSVISNGAAVMISGAFFGMPKIILAQSTTATAPTHEQIIGIATEDIPDAYFGNVTWWGDVHGIDTSGYTAGAILYVSTNAGQITAIHPLPGYSVIPIGTANNSAVAGSLCVMPEQPVYADDIQGLGNFITNNQSTAFTVSNSVYTGASSALIGPANNEFPSAGWVRGLFNSGVFYYSSSNLVGVSQGFTNSDYPNIYALVTNIPLPSARGYTNTALTAGNYLGTVVTTNTFQVMSGPCVVDSYIGFTSSGSPNVNIKPELYYSYDKTNWLGDFSAEGQAIVLGQTNLYSWVISHPTIISTNSTGFYLARRFKVQTSSGLTASSIIWATQGTNSVSGPNTATHIVFSGPGGAAGTATLPGTQTFTGTNTFTEAIRGNVIPSIKAAFSTNYTLLASDGILFCTGTNQVVTLPLAPPTGSMYTIVAATTTGGVFTTNANGTQTILGATSIYVGATNRLTVVFDGSNYW